MPDYIKLRVKIYISQNKSFIFSCSVPSSSFLISILKQSEDFDDFVHLEDIIKLALFTFPYLPLDKSMSILCSSIVASNLKINI